MKNINTFNLYSRFYRGFFDSSVKPTSNWYTVRIKEDEGPLLAIVIGDGINRRISRVKGFNKSLFIELTMSFFNMISGDSIKDGEVADYVTYQYKSVPDVDKELYIKFLEYIIIQLSDKSNKFKETKRKAFKDALKRLNINKDNPKIQPVSLKITNGMALELKYQGQSFNKEIEEFKELHTRLVDKDFIYSNTTYSAFTKIFLRETISKSKRIRWIGTTPELRLFVDLIEPLLKVPKYKFDRAANCFINKTGDDFIPDRIRRSKIAEITEYRAKGLKQILNDFSNEIKAADSDIYPDKEEH